MEKLMNLEKTTKGNFENALLGMVKPEHHKQVFSCGHVENGKRMTLYYIADGAIYSGLGGEDFKGDLHIGTFCCGKAWVFKSAEKFCN